jgi:hypothetical protein
MLLRALSHLTQSLICYGRDRSPPRGRERPKRDLPPGPGGASSDPNIHGPPLCPSAVQHLLDGRRDMRLTGTGDVAARCPAVLW